MHGPTHFDERPGAVALSKGKRWAVLVVVCLTLVMGMAVSLSVTLPDLQGTSAPRRRSGS